jgi:hypothetical protein
MKAPRGIGYADITIGRVLFEKVTGAVVLRLGALAIRLAEVLPPSEVRGSMSLCFLLFDFRSAPSDVAIPSCRARGCTHSVTRDPCLRTTCCSKDDLVGAPPCRQQRLSHA